jgi:hypothetical protein
MPTFHHFLIRQLLIAGYRIAMIKPADVIHD